MNFIIHFISNGLYIQRPHKRYFSRSSYNLGAALPGNSLLVKGFQFDEILPLILHL